ncbi:MAG: hypothetical protein ACK53A_16210 [Gemmatimonadota bacterium]|jgi:hypothetical protein|nr:hypothetical protein [Gemmatimonadota bacterium]
MVRHPPIGTGGSVVRAAMRRTPSLTALTRRERRLVGALYTPRAIQRWLRNVRYNREHGGETLRTFRGVVRDGTAHCLEGCLAAATLLDQHGHPPLVLHLASQDGLEHILALFRHRGRWGAIGRSRDEGLHGRAPVYPSLLALAQSYMVPYVDGSGRVVGWAVTDLDALLPRTDWRLAPTNAWSVDRALLRLRHRRLHMSERRYRTWLRRYLAYRAAVPAATPGEWRRFYGDEARWWW